MPHDGKPAGAPLAAAPRWMTDAYLQALDNAAIAARWFFVR